jgi:hypothetical protein
VSLRSCQFRNTTEDCLSTWLSKNITLSFTKKKYMREAKKITHQQLVDVAMVNELLQNRVRRVFHSLQI